MNIVETVLYTDVYQCKRDIASEILIFFAEDGYNFVMENDVLREELNELNDDITKVSIAEFLWFNHWREFIDYLREKYSGV